MESYSYLAPNSAVGGIVLLVNIHKRELMPQLFIVFKLMKIEF